MTHDTQLQRRTVYYRGRVQGVGFRYTARRVALEFKISGYVQNLADGRVRLVAEGAPSEIDRFLTAVASAMSPHVTDTEVEVARSGESLVGDELQGFEIRF